MESQRPPSPSIPDSGLPVGWTIEQWEYYGHEYLESNPSVNEGVKCWVCLETISTDTYQICPQCDARYHQSGIDGCFLSTLVECRNCGHPAQLFHSSGITTVPGAPEHSESIPPMISAPGTAVPTQMYNYDDGATKRSRKGILVGGSIVAILLVTILVLALLPPGNLALMDDYRDRDSDGLTDSEELDLGTDPELADTDGDGLDDSDDRCPSGTSDWISEYSNDHDGDGCRDSVEDDDDDNDGVLDADDNCPRGLVGWTPTSVSDMDGDGCANIEDEDVDGDGWSNEDERDCNSDVMNSWDKPADLDSDSICDIVDPDDDGDGRDDVVDAFPRDSTEWDDFDGDGTGDNADTDDDNDGVLDYDDANDRADVGILLSFDTFRVITKMDIWDDYAEVFICMYIEGEIVGCGPDNSAYYWSMETSYTYEIETQFFVDLPEENETHLVMICAWDKDVSDDDRIDINPSSSNNCYWFYFDSMGTTLYEELLVSGTGDNTGWDGELGFSYEFIDLREQRINEFHWDFGGVDYQLSLNLDYDTYAYFKNLNHYAGGIYEPESYGAYATPSEQYVIDIANELKALAISNGMTSELGIAEFVYAFVGDIQYILDTEGTGVNDYPKYPIEMLWESSGDCEDAAILYISLIEALGYDAMIATGLVKSSADDEWGGHAWALVHISDPPPGWERGWYGHGAESNMVFYFVEATAHRDGDSFIGNDPWYEYSEVRLYDVE